MFTTFSFCFPWIYFCARSKTNKKAFINVWSRNFTPCTSLFLYSKWILLCLEEVINENLQTVSGFIFHKHFTRGEGDLKMVNFVPLLAVLQWNLTYNPAVHVLQKLKSPPSHFVWFVIDYIPINWHGGRNIHLVNFAAWKFSAVHHLKYMQSTR